jgi:hypothetical protein
MLQPQGLSPQNIPAKAGYSCVKANINAPCRASAFSVLLLKLTILIVFSHGFLLAILSGLN